MASRSSSVTTHRCDLGLKQSHLRTCAANPQHGLRVFNRHRNSLRTQAKRHDSGHFLPCGSTAFIHTQESLPPQNFRARLVRVIFPSLSFSRESPTPPTVLILNGPSLSKLLPRGELCVCQRSHLLALRCRRRSPPVATRHKV